MEEQDLIHLTLPTYVLGSSFCHNNLQREVCVFLFTRTYMSKKLISQITKEKNVEICAAELATKASQSYYAYTEPPWEILIDLLKLYKIL
jgi:hypothetical protein